MASIKDFLIDITAASQNSRAGLDIGGRLKRSPDYTKPRISSTRPSSSRGVTFHFAHKTISKRSDVSNSQRDATSAPSHQAYIERLEAVEISQIDQQDLSRNVGLSKGFPVEGSDRFAYPDLVIEPGRDSFGTIGKNKADRVDFWREVEASEGRTARVQSRIIAELPHEISQTERLKISMLFCKTLHDEGLPYWATIHAPTKANDSRNFHLHIAYHDRPSAQDKDDKWDFSVRETRIKKNRSRVEHRPYKQNKSASVRDRAWVKFLRTEFAKANNTVLHEEGYSKRLDARSYKESGIAKTPTEHLGFKSNAAEKFGLETTRGQRNTKKEYGWRIAQSTARWDELISQHDATLLFEDYTHDDAGWRSQKDIKKSLVEGKGLALRSTKIDLLTEALSDRVGVRTNFLKSERQRLSRNEHLRGSAESQQSISLIDIETSVIENRQPELDQIYIAMQTESGALKKKQNAIWVDVKKHFDRAENPEDYSFFDNMPAYPIGDTFEEVEDNFLTQNAPVTELIEDVFGYDEAVGITKTGTIEDSPDRPIADLEKDTSEEDLQSSAPIFETHLPESEPSSDAEEITPGRSNIEPTIPGTLLVPDMDRRIELRALNERLLKMTNREVRVRAITSRDASEFLEQGEEKYQAKRGWMVLRSEAEKRGIDLETGHQDIAQATDKERAKLHTDQSNQSVLEIREELVRVMSR